MIRLRASQFALPKFYKNINYSCVCVGWTTWVDELFVNKFQLSANGTLAALYVYYEQYPDISYAIDFDVIGTTA
jgi:hypothetical protein